ncbi:RidA family protein [Ferrovibrio sp.]|uniref:RidA family protein n=1 Tax=Ferrovibrio sp. TaxID=1917215 RepID=UPI003D273E80
MAGRIAARLKELGLVLPPAHLPVATYVGWQRLGSEVWVAGVGPTWGQSVRHQGKLGGSASMADGVAAARLTALNLLAQVSQAVEGDLDRVERCLKVFALVNSTPDFQQAQIVANGITDLLQEVFGEMGRPARTAISAPSLPFDITVEADAVFLIRE